MAVISNVLLFDNVSYVKQMLLQFKFKFKSG